MKQYTLTFVGAPPLTLTATSITTSNDSKTLIVYSGDSVVGLFPTDKLIGAVEAEIIVARTIPLV
jgi:hypothetical protein